VTLKKFPFAALTHCSWEVPFCGLGLKPSDESICLTCLQDKGGKTPLMHVRGVVEQVALVLGTAYEHHPEKYQDGALA